MANTAAQDSHIQVAADGAGKRVDNAELTRDDGTVVYRQRTVLASDDNPRSQVSVEGEAGRGELSVRSRDADQIIEKLDEIVGILRMLLG